MTNREFYNAVANGVVNDEIISFAKKAIIKMDERNTIARRNSKPPKTAIKHEFIKVKDIILLLREKGLY